MWAASPPRAPPARKVCCRTSVSLPWNRRIGRYCLFRRERPAELVFAELVSFATILGSASTHLATNDQAPRAGSGCLFPIRLSTYADHGHTPAPAGLAYATRRRARRHPAW